MIVLALNAAVTRLTGLEQRPRGRSASCTLAAKGLRPGATMDPLMPPPVRRIAVDREPHVATGGRARRPRRRAPRRGSAASQLARRAARPSRLGVRERMRTESLWLAYGENWVVRDVSLPVRQGEVLALIGASGSGKTTLLRSLNRLTEVTAGAARSGRITLDGQDIHELEVNELRRRVSMVFQQPNPFPMSIFDNVAYALVEGSAARAAPPPPRRRLERAGRSRRCSRAGLYEEVATISTARRSRCRAASSSACASRARSPPSPRCCCSTSRARRSTRSPRRRSRS